jgi:ABC-type multidrug transport system fused ATPase/permease subunit
MKEFRRVFQYVWPQWPRVIVVVVSAMMISLMLSASFLTVIPLLKVMVSSEGLPAWVDGKACDVYYGLDLEVHEATTSTRDPNDPNSVSPPSLDVIHVRKHSLAAQAGFQGKDRIVDANGLATARGAGELLQTLASPRTPVLRVAVERNKRTVQIELATPLNEAAVAGLKWNAFARLKWKIQSAAVAAGGRVVAMLPREQTDKAMTASVVALMLFVTITTLLRCIAKFYQDYLGQKVVQVAVNNLRADVFAHMMQMPMRAFSGERPSDTISRIVRDTGQMGNGIQVLLGKALREPMNAIFMMAAALWLNWQLTLIFLIGAPFVVVLFGRFGHKMKKASKKSLVASSEMLSKLTEVVAALRIVKIYNQHEREQRAFRDINNRLLKQLLHMSKVDAASQPILEILGMLAGAGAIIVGMAWVQMGKGDETEFLALLVLLGASAEAVRKTSDVWNRVQQANGASERVFQVMDQPLEEERPGAIVMPPAKGNVEFRNVCFTYPTREQKTLKGISLAVKAGLNVAVVGPNGSGKTTLINLIPRFYDPDSGQVLVDGQNTREVTLASLRNQIGMVTQDILTFNDTIAANIAYGRQDAKPDEVIEAAKRAFAHEFIVNLPNGYDTVIGEHSTGLSGGQLQRIVIARAILKNPAILIFDEATSQVDAESEAKIHKAIEEVMRDRTTFIIAHRFSTVVAADMIVVMEDGRIIAQGRHDALIRSCPLYQALYETQLVKG